MKALAYIELMGSAHRAAELEKKMATSREAKAPVGSRWKSNATGRIWVVTDVKSFGRVGLKREDRALLLEVYQRDLLGNNTRIA